MTKDKYLEALGFTVLRFENRFVFQEPEIVLNEIRKVFKKDKVVIDKSTTPAGKAEVQTFHYHQSRPPLPA